MSSAPFIACLRANTLTPPPLAAPHPEQEAKGVETVKEVQTNHVVACELYILFCGIYHSVHTRTPQTCSKVLRAASEPADNPNTIHFLTRAGNVVENTAEAATRQLP